MTYQIIVLNTFSESDGSFDISGVFWLVPTNNLVPQPTLKSQVPFIDESDLLSLQTGVLVEQPFDSGLFPSGTSLATAEAYIQTLYTAAQSALIAAQSPVSVVGNTYNGSIWSSSSPFTPSAVNVTTGTLNALNSSVQISLSGTQSVGIQIAAGTFVGVIEAQVSFDGGTTWNQTYLSSAGSGNKQSSAVTLSSPNPASAFTVVVNGGAGLVQIIAAGYTSGSCAVTLRSSNIFDETLDLFIASPGTPTPPSLSIAGATVTTAAPTYSTGLVNALSLNTAGGLRVDGSGVTQPASQVGTWTVQPGNTANTTPWLATINQGGSSAAVVAKGTQGSNALAVQEMKDAGRVSFTAVGSVVAGVTTEALMTLTPVRTVTAGTAATTLTVTAGKTLRLTALILSIRNTSTVISGAIVRVRMNSGAVTVTSQEVFSAAVSTLSATTGVTGSVCIEFADGFEISGTTQFGISQLSSATTCTLDVALIGFEY